jgi:hypothetical protein
VSVRGASPVTILVQVCLIDTLFQKSLRTSVLRNALSTLLDTTKPSIGISPIEAARAKLGLPSLEPLMTSRATLSWDINNDEKKGSDDDAGDDSDDDEDGEGDDSDSDEDDDDPKVRARHRRRDNATFMRRITLANAAQQQHQRALNMASSPSSFDFPPSLLAAPSVPDLQTPSSSSSVTLIDDLPAMRESSLSLGLAPSGPPSTFSLSSSSTTSNGHANGHHPLLGSISATSFTSLALSSQSSSAEVVNELKPRKRKAVTPPTNTESVAPAATSKSETAAFLPPTTDNVPDQNNNTDDTGLAPLTVSSVSITNDVPSPTISSGLSPNGDAATKKARLSLGRSMITAALADRVRNDSMAVSMAVVAPPSPPPVFQPRGLSSRISMLEKKKFEEDTKRKIEEMEEKAAAERREARQRQVPLSSITIMRMAYQYDLEQKAAAAAAQQSLTASDAQLAMALGDDDAAVDEDDLDALKRKVKTKSVTTINRSRSPPPSPSPLSPSKSSSNDIIEKRAPSPIPMNGSLTTATSSSPEVHAVGVRRKPKPSIPSTPPTTHSVSTTSSNVSLSSSPIGAATSPPNRKRDRSPSTTESSPTNIPMMASPSPSDSGTMDSAGDDSYDDGEGDYEGDSSDEGTLLLVPPIVIYVS